MPRSSPRSPCPSRGSHFGQSGPGSALKATPQSSHTWIDVWNTFFVITIIAGVLTGQWPVVAFAAVGLVAIGVSLAWNRLALEEVTYERHLHQQRAVIGEEVAMTLALTNSKPVPVTWIRVEDEVPEELQVVEGDTNLSGPTGAQRLRQSTSMGWYEKVRWDYRLRCTRRGVFRIGPAQLESGDPFGFLRSQMVEQEQDTLMVYPRIVPLRDLGIPAVRPLGEVRGGIPIFQDVSRPAGLREYDVGDPLNAVDWKATAKRQRLQVRTFEPSSSFTIILVAAVDITEPYWKAFSPVGLDLLERVITTAASFASYATDRHYTLGLFSNDMPILAERPMTVPPSKGREQMSTVLAALATIRPFASGSMAVQLAQHSGRFPMGATLLVATAFLHPGFVDTLAELSDRGYKIVVTYVGEEACPVLPEGILVYQLSEYFTRSELRNEFGPG